MNLRRYLIIALIVVSAMSLVACGSASSAASEAEHEAEHQAEEANHEAEHQEEEAAHEAEHQEEAGHEDEDGHMHAPDDHMAGAHNVPEAAAAVPNPIQSDADSIAAGGQVFATSCAVCHGETGEGDGPGAAGLEKPPADLHADHVQGLSDGALFYIISHGKPDTPMPAWENVLSEDDRWQVVNFLRTFKE